MASRGSFYFHATADGKRDAYGRAYERVPETAVPDDAPVFALGFNEDAPGNEAYSKHWAAFHKAIDAGDYVRLAHAADACKLTACENKADADRRFGTADDERKRGKPHELTIVNGVNQLNPEYWNWNRRELKAVLAGSTEGIARVIAKRLAAAGFPVTELHIIAHTRDEKIVYDYDSGEETRMPKLLHVHWLARLAPPIKRARPLDALAEIIGIRAENLIFPQKGRYAWDNPLAYLVHAKDADKAQYEPGEVFTLCGTPYAETYAERKREWDKGRAHKSSKRAAIDLEWLLDKILTGEVSRADLHDEAGDYWPIYCRKSRRCDEVLALAADHRRQMELAAFERGEFTMTTLFVYGDSGNAKTAFVKALVSYLRETCGWLCGKGAAKNATETWAGEQIMLLDDTCSFAMTADGWKQLLDPYNASPLAERFHNRQPAKPRLLIVTSTNSPLDYFASLAASTGENISQFFRRLGNVVHVGDYEQVGCYNYELLRPKRVAEAYEKRVRVRQPRSVGDDAFKECTFDSINYDFEAPETLRIGGEPAMYAPWGAAEAIVRDIDANNRDIIGGRADADEVFHRVWEFIAKGFAPTPVFFPACYETLPPALPFSETEPGKAAKREQDKKEAEARAKAAKEDAAQAWMSTVILSDPETDDEFAGMTIRERKCELVRRDTEKRAAKAKADAERKAAEKAEEKRVRAAKEAEEKRIENTKAAEKTLKEFVATHTESFLRERVEPLLENTPMLAAALRRFNRADNGGCVLDSLEDDALLAELFGKVYALRFPASSSK